MVVIDVQIIPVGTETASVSKYVAEMQHLLSEYKQQQIIEDYVLTPMNTQIQGNLKNLLSVVEAIHELPFKQDIYRVCTNIRIDDRRDKQLTMAGKLKSVENKM